MNTIQLTHNDALVLVDVQNDFLPGGNLAVPAGDEISQGLLGHTTETMTTKYIRHKVGKLVKPTK